MENLHKILEYLPGSVSLHVTTHSYHTNSYKNPRAHFRPLNPDRKCVSYPGIQCPNKPIILPFIHSSLRKLHTIPVDLAQIVCPEKFDVKSFNATIGYFVLSTIVLIQKVARLICESDNLSKPATKCVKRQANA